LTTFLVNGDSNQYSQNTDSNQPPTQSDSLTSSKKSLPFRKRYLAGPDQDHTTNDSTAPQDQIMSETSALSVDRSTSGFDEPLIRKARLDNLERETTALDLDRSSEESSADDEDDDFQVEGHKTAKVSHFFHLFTEHRSNVCQSLKKVKTKKTIITATRNCTAFVASLTTKRSS
jgi:hypothetical protein